MNHRLGPKRTWIMYTVYTLTPEPLVRVPASRKPMGACLRMPTAEEDAASEGGGSGGSTCSKERTGSSVRVGEEPGEMASRGSAATGRTGEEGDESGSEPAILRMRSIMRYNKKDKEKRKRKAERKKKSLVMVFGVHFESRTLLREKRSSRSLPKFTSSLFKSRKKVYIFEKNWQVAPPNQQRRFPAQANMGWDSKKRIFVTEQDDQPNPGSGVYCGGSGESVSELVQARAVRDVDHQDVAGGAGGGAAGPVRGGGAAEHAAVLPAVPDLP